MLEKCNTCIRRHDASAEGFCEQFTMMPQIDDCAFFSPEAKTPIIPVVPVNKPTGEYLHLGEVSNPESAHKQA